MGNWSSASGQGLWQAAENKPHVISMEGEEAGIFIYQLHPSLGGAVSRDRKSLHFWAILLAGQVSFHSQNKALIQRVTGVAMSIFLCTEVRTGGAWAGPQQHLLHRIKYRGKHYIVSFLAPFPVLILVFLSLPSLPLTIYAIWLCFMYPCKLP